MKKINIPPAIERALIILVIILGIYITVVAFYRGSQDRKAEKAAKEKVRQQQMKNN
jgi:hypothetical protein